MACYSYCYGHNEAMPINASLSSLKHHFLIAMPTLREGLFANSITYLIEHDDNGAMGLVINQPMELSYGDIFEHLKIPEVRGHRPDSVLVGGPVENHRGFVLHRAGEHDWQSTMHVADDIYLTTSVDILHDLAHHNAPPCLVALGYAGWSPGQLEEELAANAWLTVPADSRILFETPLEQRVAAATSRLGIDMRLISSEAGHA
jgi:putative transcriptional regulator